MTAVRHGFYLGLGLLLSQGLPATSASLETAAVTRAELPRVYRCDGVAEAINRSTMSAETSGRVVKVNFDVDDHVRQGDVIVELEDEQQQAGVIQARANLQAAMALRQDAAGAFTRIEAVFAQGAVSKAEMDKATAALQQADAGQRAAAAALQQAQQELAYTRIMAPYNGIVTERLIEVGETAQPGRSLMAGLSLDSMRIGVDVPQTLVESIRTERKAQVEINGQWIAAEEITVFPIADPTSNTFKVRLRLPEGVTGVYPGMYLKAGFVAGTRTSLLIPLPAVVLRSEVVAVYVVDDAGRVHLRHIRLGAPAAADQVSVLSGLQAGERVATDPVAAGILLKSQRAVRVHDE